jgi:hypothetical protein
MVRNLPKLPQAHNWGGGDRNRAPSADQLAGALFEARDRGDRE